MKINMMYGFNAYGKMQSKNSDINKVNDNAKYGQSSVDQIEISDEGKAVLDAENNNKVNAVSGKPYDLKRILELHYKKDRTMDEAYEESAARKADPELDAALYAADKAEALEIVGKVQNILMKASSGQKLTPEEEKMVEEDPVLQQAIQLKKAEQGIMKI
ncbi:MAG: hypothetical protein Q4F66_10045 [Clostridium sp.]|nr:hypothetical protein [Clostridium sp.]